MVQLVTLQDLMSITRFKKDKVYKDWRKWAAKHKLTVLKETKNAPPRFYQHEVEDMIRQWQVTNLDN